MADRSKKYPGLIANRTRCDNAITIDRGNCINGSGPGDFGGADTWPYLRVEIQVQVGEEAILDLVERDIIRTLQKHELLGRRHTKRWQKEYQNERKSPRRKR